MAGTLSSTFQAVSKEVVLDKITKGFKEWSGMLSYLNFESGDIEPNDRGVRFSTYVRPNPSGGPVDQATALAVTGSQSFIAASCRYITWSMGSSYSGDALRQIDSPSMIEKGLSPFMRRDKETLSNEFDQQLWGNGSGEKAIRTGTAIAGQALTYVTDPLAATPSTYGARRVLYEGRYQHIDPTTGNARVAGMAGATASVAKSINGPTGTVTWDIAPTDTIAGDVLVRENAWNKCIRGFRYAISSNSLTIYGVDRAKYPEWNSNIFDAGNNPLSFGRARMMDHILSVRLPDGSEGSPDIFLGVPQFQSIESVYHPLVRVQNDANGMHSIGIDSFEFGGKNVVKQHWIADDEILYIKRSTWYKAFLQAPTPWEVNGQIFHPEPQISAIGSGGVGTYKDNHLMWLIFRGDIFCTAPGQNGATTKLGLPNDLVRPYAIGR